MRSINAELATQPLGPYSQAVEVTAASRVLYISGQLGTERDGSVPSGMESRRDLPGAI